MAELFRWEKLELKKIKILEQNKKAYSYFYPIMTSLLNALQMELFNYIYTNYFAVMMTNWENHEKMSLYDNSLILKEVTYKSINSFSSVFYIAFLKDKGECQFGDCFSEIGIQIYMNFLIYFLVRILIFFKRFVFYSYFKNDIKKKLSTKNLKFESHTIYRLKALEDIDFILVTYNDLLIFFGQIIFFSVAAPFSPIFAFLILYFFVK